MAKIKQFLPSIVKEEDNSSEPPADGPHVVIPPCVYPTQAYCSDAGYIVIRQDQISTYGETVEVLIHPVFLQSLIDRLLWLRDMESKQ
jgi:hypothetical protein